MTARADACAATVCIYMYIYICIYTYVCMYVCVRIFIHIYIHVCMYIRMYVCMYVYMYIYIYIYIAPSVRSRQLTHCACAAASGTTDARMSYGGSVTIASNRIFSRSAVVMWKETSAHPILCVCVCVCVCVCGLCI